MKQHELPPLKIIGAPQIERWVEDHASDIVGLVRDIYCVHADGKTVNPDSYFLRFPDSDRNRIIALPASIETDPPIVGLKWISSFPANIEQGLDRATALLIVNDRTTGYPLACLEGSIISAARTAASAVVGATHLHPTPGKAKRFGIVGCGPIAYQVVALLHRLGWNIAELSLTDLAHERAELFRRKCLAFQSNNKIADLEHTITKSDLLLFATAAVEPYIDARDWFEHAPTVLHISLRDLAIPIILGAQNVADDVDHCLKAMTSLHRSFQEAGNKDFIDGNIAAVIRGQIQPNYFKPRIFSPFGMGVLDLALAREILCTIDDAQTTTVPKFFPTPYVAA